MQRLKLHWQGWPESLCWAFGVSLALHLVIVLPLAYELYPTVAMPVAPLAAVLRGAGAASRGASAQEIGLATTPHGVSESITRHPNHSPELQASSTESRLLPEKTVMSKTGATESESAHLSRALMPPEKLGGAPEAAREGLEADALQRYRLAIGVEARKAKRYPEVSQARGQEGTCEVLVVLTKQGSAPSVQPGKSSGNAVLDETALIMVQIAVAHTQVPPELQGRHVRIPVRIRFTLDDV